MPKRVLQGTVVSDANEKTVVVRVERRFTHPVMKKTVRRSKKYHAHDEANVAKIGADRLDRRMCADFQEQALDACSGVRRPAGRRSTAHDPDAVQSRRRG